MNKLGMLGLSALMGIASVSAVGIVVAADQTDNNQLAKATVTTSSMRVWISSDPSNPISISKGVPGLWFHTTSDGGTNVHVTTHDSTGYGSWNNTVESNRTYYYFDVPTTVIGSYLTIQRFDSDWKTVWNSTTAFQFTEAIAEDQKVVFVWGDMSTTSRGAVGSAASSVDAGMAAKALEGLLTCNSSALNGYGAFSNINSTFIKNGETWKTSGNLSGIKIKDYSAIADYSDATKKTVEVDAYVKYLALEAKNPA